MKHSILIAAALLAAPAAFAQGSDATTTSDEPAAEAPTAPGMIAPNAGAGAGVLLSAEAIQDADVFSLGQTYDQTFWDSGEPFGQVAGGWVEIGEVEDLVLDAEAKVVGVTVDVGGFLGIGESTVLLPVADLRLVRLPDAEEFILVTRMSREQIEAAEEVGDLLGDD